MGFPQARILEWVAISFSRDLPDLVMLSRALWDSWAWRPFCLAILVGMTPAPMTVFKFQRVEEVKVNHI